MTTDPIPTPALTPFELFEALKTKGYQPRPCGDHVERGYCCPQALAEAWEEFRDDPATACEVMKRYLELDRREVFRVWYNQGEGQKNWGSTHLLLASTAYCEGNLDTCIDHILQHR